MKRALRRIKTAAQSTLPGRKSRVRTNSGSTRGSGRLRSRIRDTAQSATRSAARTSVQTVNLSEGIDAPDPERYAIEPRGSVAAVIVTHNRVDLLENSLDMVASQTYRPDWIIIVDNGADPAVETLVHTKLGGRPRSLEARQEMAARRFAEVQSVDSEAQAQREQDAEQAKSYSKHTRSGAAIAEALAAANTAYVPDSKFNTEEPEQAQYQGSERGPRPLYIPSHTNLGGAGGFALGFLAALSLGADNIWCADDDGHPADEHVLETLLRVADRERLAEVSPLVTNIKDPRKLAFPLRQGLTWRRRVEELEGDFLPGIASLFNGALISAKAMEIIGVPDYRLFIRGDEVEYHRRLVRSGLRFGTALTTAYVHPDGSDEFKPILGGRMHTQYPDGAFKRFFTYRNRGYIMSQPGMRRLLPQEYARFAWFFLVQKKDPSSFLEWLHLHRLGRRERFEHPE